MQKPHRVGDVVIECGVVVVFHRRADSLAQRADEADALAQCARVHPTARTLGIAIGFFAVEERKAADAHQRGGIARGLHRAGAEADAVAIRERGPGAVEAAAIRALAQSAHGAHAEFQRRLHLVRVAAVAAKERGIEDGSQHRAEISIAALPRGHARLHEPPFLTETGAGEIVARVKIVMHEEPAKLHAHELLRERQVRQMPRHVVAIGEAIRPGARGNGELVKAGCDAAAVGLGRVGRAEARRHRLAAEDGFRAARMVVLLVVEGPHPDEVREGRVARRVELDGAAGCEDVERVRHVHQLHRPAGPARRHVRDVRLIVAVVHAHREQLQQLAAVVFVGEIRRIAPAGRRVEIDDHRRAFHADLEEVMEGRVRVQQQIAPLRNLAPFPLGGGAVRKPVAIAEAHEHVRALARLGDEMILEELREDFQQLPVGIDRVQHQPRLHVRDVRRAGAARRRERAIDDVRGRAEARLEKRDVRVRQSRALGDGLGVQLLIEVDLRADDGKAVQQIRRLPIANAIEQRRAQERVARQSVGAEVHEEIAAAMRRGPDEVRQNSAEVLRPRMPEIIGGEHTIRIDRRVGRERDAARAVGHALDAQHGRRWRGVGVGQGGNTINGRKE